MKIKYLGHSCFEIVSKSGITIVTDPYTGVGYELPKGLRADIVTCSHGHFDHNYTAGVACDTVLTSAGEQISKGVRFVGVECSHDEKGGFLRGKNIAFKAEIDGLTVCHLGDVGEPCNFALTEKIGKVDVLFVPVGGTYTVDTDGAKAYIHALAPTLTILMHYRPSDGRIDIADKPTVIQAFENEDGFVCVGNILDIAECEDKKIVLMERK